MRPRPAAAAVLLAALLPVAACERGPHDVRTSGPTMGTTYLVRIAAPPGAGWTAERLDALVRAELDAVDQAMSTYKPTSELSRLNAAPPETWVTLSEPTMQVLWLAAEVAAATQGALDPTVGPLVDLWGFGPAGRPARLPTTAEVAATRARVGLDKLTIDARGGRVRKDADVTLDLSAVAKGFAVDQVVRALRRAEVSGMLVEVGGELFAQGVRADAQPWRVGLEAPGPDGPRVARTVAVEGVGVATSGDYRNFYSEGATRATHIIDPRTGQPVQRPLAAVTVVAPTCAEADAWATALMVLGPEAGPARAKQAGLKARFVVATGGGYHEVVTPAFETWAGDDRGVP